MNVKEEMKKLEQAVQHLMNDLAEKTELSDDDSQAIIQTGQFIEDALANLLAQHGVEIGDERID